MRMMLVITIVTEAYYERSKTEQINNDPQGK